MRIVCDRCNKIYDLENNTKIVYNFYTIGSAEENNLCPDCKEKLIYFIHKKSIKTKNINNKKERDKQKIKEFIIESKKLYSIILKITDKGWKQPFSKRWILRSILKILSKYNLEVEKFKSYYDRIISRR